MGYWLQQLWPVLWLIVWSIVYVLDARLYRWLASLPRTPRLILPTLAVWAFVQASIFAVVPAMLATVGTKQAFIAALASLCAAASRAGYDLVTHRAIGLASLAPQVIVGVSLTLFAPSDAQSTVMAHLWSVIAMLGMFGYIVHSALQRTAAFEAAQRLADEEPLTGLMNRRRFFAELDRLAAQDGAGHVTLIFADLDRFKPINDMYGHSVGDAVLRTLAKRIEVLPSVHAAARLGGDEFGIVVVATDEAAALQMAQSLRGRLELPVEVNGQSFAVGASVGVAVALPGVAPAALVGQADAAMLAVKKSGGGVRLFDRVLEQEILDRHALERDLRAAIPAAQITPSFQPIIDLETGDVRGYEVLARWHHPERGPIAPDQFIPIVERCGLGEDFFWMMLRSACTKALAVSGTFRIALNLAPEHTRDIWFPQKLIRHLAEIGFPPHRLALEITEQNAIGDLATAKSVLVSLANQGVRIALDDFGTGYSTLMLLRELPINVIKIDKTFIQAMLDRPEDESIVDAILSLARALDMSVVAEGVETPEVAAALRAKACPRVQGFLFGKPSPEIMLHPPEALATQAVLHRAAR